MRQRVAHRPLPTSSRSSNSRFSRSSRLLQQMICLERLDGRALSLPFNVVPSIEMSRAMMSSSLTVLAFLGPYIISIGDKLTAEMLCR